jgi:hypothetical protein
MFQDLIPTAFGGTEENETLVRFATWLLIPDLQGYADLSVRAV